METVIQMRNLTKILKGRRVVDNLSLEVYRGDVFGFLGPNGAGKTMTIRLLLGLIRPLGGEIIICGSNLLKNFAATIKSVGAIIEQPRFYNYLTGRQNLQVLARMSDPRTAFSGHLEEVIELVGLRNRIDSKVGTYSLGMKQRLGIAQSLLHRPDVVIYDEPTNGLDPQGMKEVRDLIRRLSTEQGITVFVSTHLLSEVEQICNRVAVINRGRLLTQGYVNELLVQARDVILEIKVDRPAEALSLLEKEQLAREVNMDGELLLVRAGNEKVPEINKFLMEKGFKLYSTRPRRNSLEEFYLQLTGGEEIA